MRADNSTSSPPTIPPPLQNPQPLPSLLPLPPSKTPSFQSPLQSKSKTTLFNLKTLFFKTLQSLLPFTPLSPTSSSRPRPIHKWPPESGCSAPRFRPYVAKVPWHGGVRAFLSQLFPRYGHYCGPNWSSGKAGGSMLWDLRPIDWLDFCCYCHDIGYDTHDQSKLLKADLAFLECLERPQMATKGGAYASLVYRSMCIAGFRYLLIPYRMQLLRVQSGPSFTEILGNLTSRVNMCKENLDRKSL